MKLVVIGAFFVLAVLLGAPFFDAILKGATMTYEIVVMGVAWCALSIGIGVLMSIE